MVQDAKQMSLEDLYEECHKRFKYVNGVLYFKGNTHSKNRRGESPSSVNNCGYLFVTVNYKSYLVHRLIYLMEHKTLPELLDHIDRNKQNNKVGNLRAANREVNSWNRDKQQNNSSGYRGVSWGKQNKKWHSYITIKGKRVNLGYFRCVHEAGRVAEEAKSEIKF